LWDAVRFAVDKRGGTGHFILTGSSVPPTDETPEHSGTGRISRFNMRPMSLSLRDLFDGKEDVSSKSSMFLEEITFVLVRGGWPDAVTGSKKNRFTASNPLC